MLNAQPGVRPPNSIPAPVAGGSRAQGTMPGVCPVHATWATHQSCHAVCKASSVEGRIQSFADDKSFKWNRCSRAFIRNKTGARKVSRGLKVRKQEGANLSGAFFLHISSVATCWLSLSTSERQDGAGSLILSVKCTQLCGRTNARFLWAEPWHLGHAGFKDAERMLFSLFTEMKRCHQGPCLQKRGKNHLCQFVTETPLAGFLSCLNSVVLWTTNLFLASMCLSEEIDGSQIGFCLEEIHYSMTFWKILQIMDVYIFMSG